MRSSYPVVFNKGPRPAGLRSRPKKPLHPNRASASESAASPTVPPATPIIVPSFIPRSELPPSSPLPSPPLSPSPKRTRRTSTPPLPLLLQFGSSSVVDDASPPVPVPTTSSPECQSPILRTALTPPPTTLPISERRPSSPLTPSCPSLLNQCILSSPLPPYADPRGWTLAEILQRCRTHAVYLQYRPSGFSGLVESWEVLDAAMRKRHAEHSDEGWEKAFRIAHRNKWFATFE